MCFMVEIDFINVLVFGMDVVVGILEFDVYVC